MKQFCAVAFAFLVSISIAHAQSADLVLCDRVAADPPDPDKPADIKGVNEIAPSDVAIALKFCKNASGSSRRALYQLGRAYAANKQMQEAAAAYRKAAEKGSTSAMVELGIIDRGPDSRKLLERAAEAGNPRAIAALASTGNAATQDPARLRDLLSKGSGNNPEAQYQLAMLLAEGVGGPKDEVSARALFDKAAAQGHAGALERMGNFLRYGRGGPEDRTGAKNYYEKAAALGNEDAKAALERMRCPYVIKDKRGNAAFDLCP